jgi:hypothetical protein
MCQWTVASVPKHGILARVIDHIWEEFNNRTDVQVRAWGLLPPLFPRPSGRVHAACIASHRLFLLLLLPAGEGDQRCHFDGARRVVGCGGGFPL